MAFVVKRVKIEEPAVGGRAVGEPSLHTFAVSKLLALRRLQTGSFGFEVAALDQEADLNATPPNYWTLFVEHVSAQGQRKLLLNLSSFSWIPEPHLMDWNMWLESSGNADWCIQRIMDVFRAAVLAGFDNDFGVICTLLDTQNNGSLHIFDSETQTTDTWLVFASTPNGVFCCPAFRTTRDDKNPAGYILTATRFRMGRSETCYFNVDPCRVQRKTAIVGPVLDRASRVALETWLTQFIQFLAPYLLN